MSPALNQNRCSPRLGSAERTNSTEITNSNRSTQHLSLRELAIRNSLQQQQATAQRGAGREQIEDFESVPIESVPSVSVLIRSCSKINPSTQTQMRNPFTFFPIKELVSPEGYNFENAKMGDMLTFKTVCGGEVVDFICHLNSIEIIYTVKNNLVCFF